MDCPWDSHKKMLLATSWPKPRVWGRCSCLYLAWVWSLFSHLESWRITKKILSGGEDSPRRPASGYGRQWVLMSSGANPAVRKADHSTTLSFSCCLAWNTLWKVNDAIHWSRNNHRWQRGEWEVFLGGEQARNQVQTPLVSARTLIALLPDENSFSFSRRV